MAKICFEFIWNIILKNTPELIFAVKLKSKAVLLLRNEKLIEEQRIFQALHRHE